MLQCDRNHYHKRTIICDSVLTIAPNGIASIIVIIYIKNVNLTLWFWGRIFKTFIEKW